MIPLWHIDDCIGIGPVPDNASPAIWFASERDAATMFAELKKMEWVTTRKGFQGVADELGIPIVWDEKFRTGLC